MAVPNVSRMAVKTGGRPQFECGECGWTSPRWVGRCGECQAWGSVSERDRGSGDVVPIKPAGTAVPITSVEARTARGRPTGIGELDRVLGEGLVPGAVLLLAGEPGVGKSTLLLAVASRWAQAGRRTLYVTGEESASQVAARAGRTGCATEELLLAAESDLATILGHVEQVHPELLVVDSIQTVTGATEGATGGVTQIRESAIALIRVAKRRSMACILVGHVTKDGNVAGPRLLEHLVDVVLSFEGDKHTGLRLVRASKNRFGPADELGCFEMTATGITELPDPSGVFLASHPEPIAGTCVSVALEGRRPLVVEVQALVAPTLAPVPRRAAQGIDSGRMAMILAAVERRAGIRLHNKDVYAATVGGVRLGDPSADLAVAIAVASAGVDRAFPQRVVAFGEVGLSGDLRRVPNLDRRLAEAARLGFSVAIVPSTTGGQQRDVGSAGRGLRVVEAATVAEALGALGLLRASRAPDEESEQRRRLTITRAQTG